MNFETLRLLSAIADRFGIERSPNRPMQKLLKAAARAAIAVTIKAADVLVMAALYGFAIMMALPVMLLILLAALISRLRRSLQAWAKKNRF